MEIKIALPEIEEIITIYNAGNNDAADDNAQELSAQLAPLAETIDNCQHIIVCDTCSEYDRACAVWTMWHEVRRAQLLIEQYNCY